MGAAAAAAEVRLVCHVCWVGGCVRAGWWLGSKDPANVGHVPINYLDFSSPLPAAEL
jgi:hypothetical protein